MRTPRGKKSGDGRRGRSSENAEPRTWLPVTVVQEGSGKPSPAEVQLHRMFLAALSSMGKQPDPGLEFAQIEDSEAQIARSADDIDRLLRRIETSLPAGEGRSRLEDVLSHVSGDPGRHVVLSYDRHGDVGFAAFSRSVEMVDDGNGIPAAIRLVVEILGVAKPRSEAGMRAIEEVAAPFAFASLASLLQVKPGLIEALDEVGLDDSDLSVEYHIRAADAADANFGDLLAVFLDMFDGIGSRFMPEMFDRIRLSGPFVPGTYFLEETGRQSGDTAAALTKRQTLRTLSLVAGSIIRHGMKGASPGPHHLLMRADAESRSVAEFALDPTGPRAVDVLGPERNDPKVAVMHIVGQGSFESQLLYEMRREISLDIADGKLDPAKIEISMPAWIGSIDDDLLAAAAASALADQMADDCMRLSLALGQLPGAIRMVFVVAPSVARIIDSFVVGFHEDVARFVGRRHEVLPVEVRESSPRPPLPRPSGRAWPLLPEAVEILPDMLLDGVDASLERDGREAEVHGLDVLVRSGPQGPAHWIDVHDLDKTQEAFLLGRAWIDGTPTPVLISPITGTVFEEEELDLPALIADMGSGSTRTVDCGAAARVAELAEPLFWGTTSVSACMIDHVVPDTDGYTLLSSTQPDLDEEIGRLLGCVGGDGPGDPRNEYVPTAARFQLAVHEDLRTPIALRGPAAVVAQALAWGAEPLLTSERESPERSLLFASALAYVKACRPDCMQEEEFRKAMTDLMADVASRASEGYDLDKDGHPIRTPRFPDDGAKGAWVEEARTDLIVRVAKEMSGRIRVPLYAAVACIAAATESFQLHHDNFGTVET